MPESPEKRPALLRELRYIPQTLRLVWAAAPRWTSLWVLLLLAQGLIPLGIVWLSRRIVDQLVSAMGTSGGDRELAALALTALLLGAVFLVAELLRSALEYVHTAQAELIQDHVSGLVHAQAVRLDLAFYDSPQYHDQRERATREGGQRAQSLLASSGSLLSGAVTLVALASVLVPYAPWLPVVLLASALPSFFILVLFHRRQHAWWERTTSDRRWSSYYDFLLTQRDAAAEMRLFDLGATFGEAYRAVRAGLRVGQLKLLREQALARLAAGALGLVVTGAVLAWAGLRALDGRASLGDIVLLQQAFVRGQQSLRATLGDLGQLYRNALFLRHLFEFLALQSAIIDPPAAAALPQRLERGIQFRNVTFRYPGAARAVLAQFNLTIPAGSAVSIVGANGAGKSTLIKLLLRFYDPEEGSIEFDGIDLRRVSLRALRRFTTVLFQDPIGYQASAARNIALGDLAREATPEAVHAAAMRAGADEVIARLPQGYDTLLGRAFEGGSDMSLGEYQRVALARAFYRNAEIVILDEPTSFLDSWAEQRWLATFQSAVRGRTSIVITHRFTTAMLADKIFVMDEGGIVESGSHAELVAAGGAYAQSWRAQSGAARA